MRLIKSILVGSLLSVASFSALAAETPIGKAVEKNGMEIGAVYLQSVVMDPMMPNDSEPSDVHLEADVHAVKGNQNGFAVGEWIPFLQISYHLTREGSTWQQTGVLMPMVANDGPHYGANVKLDGAGHYHLTFHINPPPYNGFVRHTDKETGVAPWWKQFEVSWDFSYIGTGKKGGY